MAFQKTGLCYIPPYPTRAVISTLQNLLIDAVGEKAACVFEFPKTGNVAKVGFLTGTVTTGDTVDARLEGVSITTGDPTGTLLAAGSNKTQVIDAADDATWFLPVLTTPVAVIKGDPGALVIANGTAPGVMNIRTVNFFKDTMVFPYSDHFTAAWAKVADHLVFALEYDDGSYEPIPAIYPSKTVGPVSFNSSSTPDERALKFKSPVPLRVVGAWVHLDLAENADIVLYSGTTALQTKSIDKDLRVGTSADIHLVTFPGVEELAKDTFYRLAVKPTTTTNVSTNEITVDTAAIMDAMDWGQDFHFSSRTDAGAWDGDDVLRRPIMGLITDGLDDGVSAGGSITPEGSTHIELVI